MQGVRIVEMPPCRAVLSQPGMFGDGKLESFDAWISMFPRDIWPKDFLYYENGLFRWAYLYEEGMNVPGEYEIADWPGGLYAVATDIDQQTDRQAMDEEVMAFIERYGLMYDDSRPELGNIITSPVTAGIIGCEQMDYWYPVRKRA